MKRATSPETPAAHDLDRRPITRLCTANLSPHLRRPDSGARPLIAPTARLAHPAV